MKRFINRIIYILVIVCSISIFTSNIYAENDKVNFNDINLYNETNKYNFIGNNNENSARYNLEEHNYNVVDDSKPMITVLTHGLGGKAAHWSNKDGEFCYVKNSLVSRLLEIVDCNIYIVGFFENDAFMIKDVSTEYNDRKKKNSDLEIGFNKIDHITDISKHSIIIFQASDDATDGSNDEAYKEFNYAISRIVYDIKKLNNDKLPKINLIGHSRGGITNMQYALDHPDLVDSIYSLGTPYIGSTSASLDYYFFGSRFENSIAERDIVDSNVYLKYLNRWNDNYDKLYSKIKVTALGSYSTLAGLAGSLTSKSSLDFLEPKTGINRNVLDPLIRASLLALNGLVIKVLACSTLSPKYMKTLIIKEIISMLTKAFSSVKPAGGFDDLAEIIFNEIRIDYNFPFVSWYNDGLVDLGSQLGSNGNYTYRGFKSIKKCFTGLNCDYNALAVSNMPSVVHNMEIMDVELGNYIISSIELGNKKTADYLISDVGDNECSINLYTGKGDSEILVIPEYINNKKVVAIADYAFANNFYNNNDITSVAIPNSVTNIGKYAFYNCDNISKIEISKSSELKTIETCAFSNMPKLSSFSIPNDLSYIGKDVFLYSGIINFDIYNNQNYSYINNILIDKNVSNINDSIAIYVNPFEKEITFPSNVKILASSVFEGNKIIEKVDLNNVEMVGDNAFYNSTLKEIVGGLNIKNAGNNVFINTPWLNEKESDFITIGTVLLKYTGNSTKVVVPEGITRLCEDSFESNEIKEIVLPSTVDTIGASAFINCNNLESILFTSTKPPVLDGKIASSKVKFLVKASSLNYYENSLYFSFYKDQIETKKINIEFLDIEGKTIGETIEEYASSLDNYIKPLEIDGYDFKCFINQFDEEININSFLNRYDDLILKPIYEKSKYTIHLFNDGNDTIYDLEYLTQLDIEIPLKDGYEFIGWFDDLDNGNKIIDETGLVVWERMNEVECVYARYKLITYTISYNTNGGEFVSDNLRYTFDVENPITTKDICEIRKFGYVFEYWRYLREEFSTTYGIFKDIYLLPKFSGNLKNYSKGLTINLIDEYSIIDLSNAKENDEYRFVVTSTVKTLTFKGENKYFNNMQINVAKRSGALVLGFEDIKFSPKKSITGFGIDAIEASSSEDLYITYKGNVEISGGEGMDGSSFNKEYDQAGNNQNGRDGRAGLDGQRGGYGIRGNKIIFSQFDSSSFVKIVGGKGGNGGRGADGEKGGNGLNPPSGWFWNPIKGDDGANGGNGGTGGNGGAGGYAIYVSSKSNLFVGDTMNYKFIGGSGGVGGTGGLGGDGGNGASDTSANIFTGVGDPGDGGNGGKGGNGGVGGNGTTASNAINVYGYPGKGGARGIGNIGGAAGEGGSAGQNGDNGKKGLKGANGKGGSDGLNGIDGYYVAGNNNGILITPYVFNKQFLYTICRWD